MNQFTYDLVIFDCDGVLVDTEPLANEAFIQLLREHGFNVDENKFRHEFSGLTLLDRLDIAASELNWNPPDNFLDLFNERMTGLTEKKMQPVSGIHKLLESLPVPACVASNGSRDELNLRLKLGRLTPFFKGAIFSGLEVPNPKPAPDVYLAAASAFNIPPDRCIVVEDSIPGATAGIQAGMRVFGYAAFTPMEKLQAAGAIPFQTMDELREILAEEYSQMKISQGNLSIK